MFANHSEIITMVKVNTHAEIIIMFDVNMVKVTQGEIITMFNVNTGLHGLFTSHLLLNVNHKYELY